jgi:hypothetical protein
MVEEVKHVRTGLLFLLDHQLSQVCVWFAGGSRPRREKRSNKNEHDRFGLIRVETCHNYFGMWWRAKQTPGAKSRLGFLLGDRWKFRVFAWRVISCAGIARKVVRSDRAADGIAPTTARLWAYPRARLRSPLSALRSLPLLCLPGSSPSPSKVRTETLLFFSGSFSLQFQFPVTTMADVAKYDEGKKSWRVEVCVLRLRVLSSRFLLVFLRSQGYWPCYHRNVCV